MVDTPIGTNSPNYTLVSGDVGATIFCRVTATNASGSAQAFSNAVGPVAAAGGPVPGITTAPAVTVAVGGASVSCSTGTWTNTPTGYAYQWYSDETPDVAISGATSATYVIDGGVIAAPAAWAFIASISAAGLGDVPFTSSAIDTTGADLLIVAVGYAASSTNAAVTDSMGNTWAATTRPTDIGNMQSRILYCKPTVVGPGHTITVTSVGSAARAAVTFAAFSGAHATPFDQQNAQCDYSAVATAGSITPSVDNCLVVSVVGVETSTITPTISGGGTWTMLPNVPAAAIVRTDVPHYGSRMAYSQQATLAATNPSWAIDEISWSSTIASFKPV